MNLSKDTKITQAVTVTNGAAGSSNINGVTLDMNDFESVLMRATFGAIVSGAATSIKAQQGDLSDASDMSDLLGTSQTIGDTDDENTHYIDLVKPEKRYVRLVVLRATQNSTVEADYQQYGARKAPVTHGSNVAGETHVSPIEGTA
jgi:hypothetical protein